MAKSLRHLVSMSMRFIRYWDAKSSHEVYRITVGLGGLGCGSELCIWSLFSLRYGTLLSADISGTVQFWDSSQGTLLQAYSCHKGDVNALAASPSHNRCYLLDQMVRYYIRSLAMLLVTSLVRLLKQLERSGCMLVK